MSPKNSNRPRSWPLSCVTLACVAGICTLGAQAFQDTPPASDGKSAVAVRKPTVLLLTNGHVFQGEILEDATGYYLKHKIGVKQFARRNVAGVFDTLEAAYDAQAKRIPKNDPDEHMKLALWCLEHDLKDQAREQLQSVVALSDSDRARRMLFQLESKPAAELDPEVKAAEAVVTDDERAGGEPRQLSQSVLEQLRGQKSAGGPPRIFDLPAPLAVKRYQEFARYVHGHLQNQCARCHDVDNPKNAGSFRLVRTRNARDLQNDMVLRANLEATLDLVDPENLTHSKLLTVAVMTHPPDGKPVLNGPTHPAYRVFQTWVASLVDPNSPNAGTAPPRDLQRTAQQGEGFATGRAGNAPAPAPGAVAPLDDLKGSPVSGTPRMRQQMAGTGKATAPGVPGDVSFPDPRVPTLPQEKAAPPIEAPASSKAASGRPEIVQNPDGSSEIHLPDGRVLPYIKSKDLRPEADARPGKDGTSKPKVDTKVLDRYLQERNAAKK